MNNNETPRASQENSEFANFVIPGSEALMFDALAEKMRKASPFLAKSAIEGVNREADA